MKDLLRISYKILRSLIRIIQRQVSPSAACKIQNLFLVILHYTAYILKNKNIKSDVRFFYEKSSKLFYAEEGSIRRYFGEMDRGFHAYERGLIRRGQSLSNSYCLQNVNFNSSDIVIDCGANYADLFISLSNYINETNYITFEPGPSEYNCIKKNVPKARNYNYGLSDKEGEMEFYLCSASGDSSLVEPKNYTDIIKVNVTTLDLFVAKNNIEHCKLLKLEAEGWEPEILDGAKEFLSKCEYVAIDGGRERGVNEEATFHILNNKLLNNGFEMIDIYGPVYRALYRKKL
tara:strand:+ start:286 stop:1152 length:867 start_codon:yes stop_codon:yes gene_type:complete